MNVRRCVMCGVLFNSFGSKKCPECIQEMDRKFLIIRDFIYQNEEADVMQISEETGIDGKVILEFLKEGRLTLGIESSLLSCESCGKPIRSGKYCEACRQELEDALNGRVSRNKIMGEKNASEKKKVTRMHVNFDRFR